ncbi:GNAT family N-acetyltransferase [Streptomyces sp. SID14478]|uniref:GNAT family N-acetyltransferase n=1 Tax=Streptomyces sp. SID14478 TaxID=2706073 RepID=UPI0013DC8BB3|nr:GNAT family N-acetyltransferase [Streptomyces sp. SID14478]
MGDLLADVVHGGASLGFLDGLTAAAAADWWRARASAVERGALAVWAALDEASGRCLGTVSLAFNDWPNGRHRAEILKLMVHGSARGKGLARTLLATAERAAADAGITLLVLDTETGSPAEPLYRSAGWTTVGVIPDYAADPAGVPRPTTLFYKRPGVREPATLA